MFTMDRVEGVVQLNNDRIARAIEDTRFPSTVPSEERNATRKRRSCAPLT